MRLTTMLFALAALSSSAAMLPAQVQQGTAPAAAIVLRPGDAIRIGVWRRPELSGEFTVGTDGGIVHPLYRSVHVSGVPIQEVEQRLAAFLTQFDAKPAFVLEPLVRVILSGQVENPNVYNLRPATTIAQAVAVAGGATDRGNLRAVQLLRDGAMIELDLTRPAGAVSQMPIRSGDQIMIPRTRAIFREIVTPTLTVVGAVAAVANVILRSQR